MSDGLSLNSSLQKIFCNFMIQSYFNYKNSPASWDFRPSGHLMFNQDEHYVAILFVFNLLLFFSCQNSVVVSENAAVMFYREAQKLFCKYFKLS